MNSGDKPSSRRRGVRLYHKKSRHGCVRCKARRVKCDEEKPACGGCTRHAVPCVYNTPTVVGRQGQNRAKSDQDSEMSSQQDSPDQGNGQTAEEMEDEEMLDVPESESKRLLELRLLQNYLTDVIVDGESGWGFTSAPKMALQPGNEQKNMLYAMLCLSAMHLDMKEPGNRQMAAARQTYLGLALREHRKAVAQLSAENTLSVCYTSLLLLSIAFCGLRERPLEPYSYSPPLEWLQMGSRVIRVFEVIMEGNRDFDIKQLGQVFDSPGWLADISKLYVEENRRDFVHLLQPDPLETQWRDELADPEIRLSYEETLSYIGSVNIAIQTKQAVRDIYRQLLAFAVLVPHRFVDLLAEQRPRALAILAHFFALVTHVDQVWFVGGIGRRELLAIQKSMPLRWQAELRWPLSVAGLSDALK
ncbi:hypothetical protein ASPZODRAFT_65964 [Penicilliopsis zonata CBS 506.65]|uniref:Zn(2)-C6 fungal-type domain-containing protein n=1 Tax=Penicilliopsis zonata CBS 506.65 TaxID=1073090 RepID=A0A1L9SHV0_9EURO|nr:hypothetical protein ASPZODRAFT_65964 [Penicilliopsis zonata CBS 506.65]OJJ46785.1 hypothetical protein ASPZODRAFT_65964 [Penicilliopsis zonata CBS 506.65]